MSIFDQTPAWFAECKSQSDRLVELSEQWSQLEIFEAVADHSAADRLIELSVPHTYLFGRFTVPYYLLNISKVLLQSSPANGDLAKSLKGCLGLVNGEICTNNIFEKPGDCHAHYYDIKECASQGLSVEFGKFEKMDGELGFWEAMEASELWSPSMRSYARAVCASGENVLASFLVMWVSEHTIPLTYHTILNNLPDDKQYQNFRAFIEKHIHHDEHDHGPATEYWLNLSGEAFQAKDVAIELAANFVQARIHTYQGLL